MWDTRKHATFQQFLNAQTVAELHDRLEWLHGYFEDCRESGQGINSKEIAWERGLIDTLRQRGERATYWN